MTPPNPGTSSDKDGYFYDGKFYPVSDEEREHTKALCENLKTLIAIDDDSRKVSNLPDDLVTAIHGLTFKSQSDKRLALDAVSTPWRATSSTRRWLAALVSRKGERFDPSIEEHCEQHDWPLASHA